MKKSVLALGAAAAMGFAGGAHAIAFFGPGNGTDGNPTNATVAQLNPGGLGHYLFTPYYSTQADTSTLLSIVNTDTVNAKAVKVRFRGAANSDDVLDFTLFLSPGDVWTANVSVGPNGVSALKTHDNSCILPLQIMGGDQFDFLTGRLDQSLDDDALALHTREGYVEYLTMADIKAGTDLFKTIKHNAEGKAPCVEAVLNTTLGANVAGTTADMEALGLYAPTDGLMGSWIILRNSDVSSVSGNDVAVQARDATGGAAIGNYAFSPQIPAEIPAGDYAATVDIATNDPLLASAGGPIIPAQWFDLPDMSTPMFGSDPAESANKLSLALGKDVLINEFAWQKTAGKVPFDTDWVVSQPTRRYWVAMDYDAGAPVFDASAHNQFYTTANVRTRNSNVVDGLEMGAYLCLTGELAGLNREEGGVGAAASPGTLNSFCGETFTLSFQSNTSDVLKGKISNTPARVIVGGKPVEFGWATLNLKKTNVDGTGASIADAVLPMVGYSASHASDGVNWYGYSFTHRWR